MDLGALAGSGGGEAPSPLPVQLQILVGRAVRAKCARCWRYEVEAATEAAGGDLCARCEGVMQELEGARA